MKHPCKQWKIKTIRFPRNFLFSEVILFSIFGFCTNFLGIVLTYKNSNLIPLELILPFGPLLTFCISSVMNLEEYNKWKLFALFFTCFSIIGLTYWSDRDQFFQNDDGVLDLLLCVLTTLSSSSFIILQTKLKRLNVFFLMFCGSCFSFFVGLGISAYVLYTNNITFSSEWENPRLYLMVFFGGIVIASICFCIIAFVARVFHTPSIVSLYSCLQPTFTSLFLYFFYGDTIQYFQVIGGGLVILTICFTCNVKKVITNSPQITSKTLSSSNIWSHSPRINAEKRVILRDDRIHQYDNIEVGHSFG